MRNIISNAVDTYDSRFFIITIPRNPGCGSFTLGLHSSPVSSSLITNVFGLVRRELGL